jgi:TolB-like protein/Tfp pilus assembly protein PilF
MQGESPTQASAPAGAIFLSYASQDAEAAKRICEALRAGGIEVWFDQSELRGGDAWDRQIRKQIHDCAFFVPVISQHTHERLEGYFRSEWRLAVERAGDMAENKAFLVPIVIDGTTERDPSVPEKFRELQWTRLPDGQVPPAFIERVQRLLSSVEPDALPTARPTHSRVSASPQTGASTSASWRTNRPLLVAAAVAVLGALTYFAIDRSWTPKHPALLPTPPGVPVSATPAAFSPPVHSIAVLPFVNMSGDKEQEYFSDGLTEELLNSLSRVNELQVAGRTSSFYFKGKDVDLSTVTHKLNVGAVLEGSVRRSANTVRITAQLVNGTTGFHLWSQTYDRDLGDVLKLQTEIATAVANALRVTLLPNLAAKIELGGTQVPAAFDAYLRAFKADNSHLNTNDELRAVADYTEAIRLDPNYALAFVGRSIALSDFSLTDATGSAFRQRLDRAHDDAHKALALAPDLVDAHLALATALEGTLDFAGAQAEFLRALAIAPSNPRVLRDYALFASFMGQVDEALNAGRRAVELDPLNGWAHQFLGTALLVSRRYEAALAALMDAETVDPKNASSHGYRGTAYYLLGDLEQARSSCETEVAGESTQLCLAIVYQRLGRHPDAEAALAKLRASMGDARAFHYAEIYTQWGRPTQALESLDTAVRLRSPWLERLKTDPLLDPLRNEPRFQLIERALKFPD